MFVMALPWLLVLELVLYAGCFICGIIAAASLTINQGHFAGRCILYGSVHLNASDQSLVMESSSSPSLCYFVSAISVCVSIYCFSLILYWMYTSCVDKDANRDRSGLNMTLVLCGAVVFFLLVSGCVLRIGREHLCISILQTLPSLSSCEEAENKTWASPYFGNQFSSELHRAEMSVWVNFFFWVLIVAVVGVQRRHGAGFRGADWNAAEREPFFHRPTRA
ncbi:transmembrane protein 179B isoform X2 [Clupea harengus]|uniref:Transmembrane protein 179B isoform X2 n=1 Tax=Clupea harengus TaxID=7950 RepID=A0A6P3WD22_CLUHA|nr:transmembrane protein 179B isoform X2 [Clupea harengus]